MFTDENLLSQEHGMPASAACAAADNVCDILLKIIQFTQARQQVLTQNLKNINQPGFLPTDLPVQDFSEAMDRAIDQHLRTRCLMLRDGPAIKFGRNGTFTTKLIPDLCALELLSRDQGKYIELQINKLAQNALNQRVAAELLRQRHSPVSTPSRRKSRWTV